MNTERKKQLEKLAKLILNDKGQEDIQDSLDENNEQRAIVYLLGAVDRCYKDGLNEVTAAEYYKILGVPLERASTIRQASGKL